MRLAMILFPLARAGCAGSAEMQASQHAEAQRDLSQALAGRVAGKPQDCIPIQGISGPQVVDRSTVIYRDGRRVYVNQLASECPSLSPFDTLVVELHNNQLCRNDLFRVLQSGSSIPGAYCRFGSFTPYLKQ
jgi:hypothetical protein